ncbi:uncharacterized protein Z519_11142 [Cladophialophora bantiana CBS 173.52]|uniref:Homeobox domain-containing protein n=1 Tax=Cladophialophora bantiana (strain ATCC 10958 / CBS 173.52 / CDC B-1940 / NIH 8579) TaxID=1442370 RepID=A0A0D2FMW9_CLAB1|nr:uncharacterized protein Z519_11142 [Cladophialophora bantiana CBS 173.52]KIW88032.1 hypothetical protein Z519_11142 [Cladophialophora bantiana CBS 173.52]
MPEEPPRKQGVSLPTANATSDEVDPFRRSVARLPRLVTKTLRQWFVAHASHPYPTEQEKKALQEQTNLSDRQIANWFANARRRYTANSFEQHAPSSGRSISVPNLVSTSRWQDMSPLDRWRHSPPDQEPAPFDAIAVAVRHSLHSNGSETTRLPDSFNTTQRLSHAYSDNSFESLSSLGTSQSSNSTGSAFSFESNSTNPNFQQSWRLPRSRRRRRPLKQSQSSSAHPSNGRKTRKYQCTFCTDTFASKYDWTRHESALHLSLEKWVCCPQGPIFFDRVPRCSFCEAENPSFSHLQSHRHDECTAKPGPLRTFGRKDHLRQHMHIVHRVEHMPDHVANWKTRIASINCRCGFCGERFVDWPTRNNHIAEHFRDGASMRDWTGCRGLDPEIALLVENAMPPYLIDSERKQFEPFSASRNTGQEMGAVQHSARVPTSFESLTARLGAFVLQAMKDGVVVTDETVRRQARTIMYGDDDAWNQTPADNAEWLRLFKEGVRLKSAAEPLSTQVDPRLILAGSAAAGGQAFWQDSADASLLTRLDSALPPAEAPSPFESMDLNSDLLLPYAYDDLTSLPLCWQTPECLAEFSQMSCTQRGGAGKTNACTNSIGSGTLATAESGVPSPHGTGCLGSFPAKNNHSLQQGLSPAQNKDATGSPCPFSEWTRGDDFSFPCDLSLPKNPS